MSLEFAPSRCPWGRERLRNAPRSIYWP